MSKPTCSIDGCQRIGFARSWCSHHYNNWRASGDPENSVPREGRECSAPDCGRGASANGLCTVHYQRLQKHGHFGTVRKRNICSIDGCGSFVLAQELCTKHYSRWKRHGSATARMRGEVIDGKRICPGCGEDKPLSQYSPGATGPCKRCRAAHELTPMRQEKRAAWAAANREKMRHYARVKAHDRRVLVASATTQRISRDRLNERMAFFGNRCWMCLGPFEHIDHVKPLSGGGPHILANLRPSCRACNQSKSSKWEGVAWVAGLAA